MNISNTAVPKYYGEFREQVLRGEIPVCKEIAMEMARIDARIEDPNIYYSPNDVEGFIAYCENEHTLTDGSDLKLLPTFKLWSEQIFGWYEFTESMVFVPPSRNHKSNRQTGYFKKKLKKTRLIKKQFLIISRGNAKTLYMTLVQSYFLNIDRSATKQITVAPTMAQADEVMSAFRTAITRAKGPLFQFLTDGSLQNTTGNKLYRQKLCSTKKGIQNFLNGSILEVKPMSIDKLQGLRTKVVTIDEWLSCDIREDIIGTVEQGCSKNINDYLILCASSEGTVRNNIGDSIKMELMKILRGEFFDPSVSIFYYKQDSVEEVGDPTTWLKSNPNLGITVTYETLQRDVIRAEQSPSNRNDILAKRFGIPMEGFTYFFTYEETKVHPSSSYNGCACALGADLSQGNDFCAFTFLFPLSDGSFGIKVRSYISSNTLDKLQPALRLKYQDFINEDTLIILDGINLDMMAVYENLDDHIIQMQYDVRTFGYDPYNAKEFVDRYCKENGYYGVEKVIQGAKTESVPLGELKNLSEMRYLIFDEELMSFTMTNAITLQDTNGNRKLLKKKYEAKIDNVAALLDAYVSYKRNKEAFE